MNIRFKVSALVLALSITSFIGFGILIVNGQQVRLIARGLTVDYEDALARESFSKFNDFLNAIQASSGISQTLGETFYGLKDTLSRQQLMDKMLYDYRTTFARELNLLGGGAFYEPYAFYPNIHDFHCFVSKELSAGSLPTERNVVWLGDEWEWDVDTYDEGWYLTALPNGWNRSSPRQDRYYWSELYVDTSVDALMVTVSLPIYSSAKIMVGVATVDISLSTLQKMVASFPLPTPSTQIAGFSVINNATFAVSGSSNYDVVEYPQGSWLNHLVDLKPGQTVNKTLNLNGKEYSLSAFVHDSGIGVALLVPNEEKFAAVDALQRASYITVISIVLVMIAVVVIVIIAISIWIVRPIKMTSLLLETFAKGDLTQVLSVNGNDELALMTRMIASAQDGIRSLIAAIGEKASILSEIGSDLASNMNITANAVNQITANVQSIKLRVQNQSAYVSQTHGTMDQLVANINKLDSHVANQSSNVSQASSAIEEMVANTRSVTDTLIKNTANVNTLREASEIGRHGLQEVAADIQEISRESEGLLEINSVMESIASQTNLLSMNAAIEAAHAGEAGKGFAVVAGEIRKLAESSSQQSKTIGSVLKKIKGSIDKITRSTGNVLDRFEAIDSSVRTVAEQEENIRNAMEEQGTGSKQVLEGVGNVNEITRQVTGDTDEMLEMAKEVKQESTNLEKATQEISSGINEMASGADEINTAVNHVNKISGKNRDAIDVLLKEVSRFKVE